MKLIWHLCKKDFVHLRFAVGLWVLLVGCELFFNQRLLSPAGIDREWFERASLLSNLFVLITLVVSYLMMASLVLDDPAVGTQMFWATRPISGGRLLGAKLLGLLLLFGALPILLRLPWWLYCGYGAGELGRAALQSLAAVGLLAVPAVVLAALSGQSSRFLLYSLLLLVMFPMASLWLASRTGPRLDTDLIMNRVLLSNLVVAMGGLAAAVSQFLNRRSIRSFVILSVAVAAAAACLFLWPWRLNQFWATSEPGPAGAEQISAEILEVSLFPVRNASGPANTNLALTLRLHHLPADRMLLAGFADAVLRWPDGTIVHQPHLTLWPHTSGDRPALRRILALPPPAPDAETARKLAALREERLRQHPPRATRDRQHRPVLGDDDVSAVINLIVSPEIAARIRAEPPGCSLSAQLSLGRPDVLFEMPMRQGAAQSGHGARLHVLDVAEEAGGTDDPVDEVSQKWTLTLVSASSLNAKPFIYRVDRERGVLERIQNTYSYLPTFPLVTNIARISSRLTVPRIWRTDRWLNEPVWLSAQTLAAVAYRQERGLSCTVEVDRLPLPSPSE